MQFYFLGQMGTYSFCKYCLELPFQWLWQTENTVWQKSHEVHQWQKQPGDSNPIQQHRLETKGLKRSSAEKDLEMLGKKAGLGHQCVPVVMKITSTLLPKQDCGQQIDGLIPSTLLLCDHTEYSAYFWTSKNKQEFSILG